MPKWKNVPADWMELVGKTIVYMDPTEGDETVNFRATNEDHAPAKYGYIGTYYTILLERENGTGLTKRVLVEEV